MTTDDDGSTTADLLVRGTAWTFGDDIDTDVILPWEYGHLEPEEYAQHVMEPVAPSFADEISPGDVVVGGLNFGIGSSREHAPIALANAGVGAIVAASFARIFYRNAINQGLPVIECAREDIHRIEDGDELEIDVDAGRLTNLSTGETYHFDRFDEPVRSILAAGGAKQYYG